jgi:hypothetical protein
VEFEGWNKETTRKHTTTRYVKASLDENRDEDIGTHEIPANRVMDEVI